MTVNNLFLPIDYSIPSPKYFFSPDLQGQTYFYLYLRKNEKLQYICFDMFDKKNHITVTIRSYLRNHVIQSLILQITSRGLEVLVKHERMNYKQIWEQNESVPCSVFDFTNLNLGRKRMQIKETESKVRMSKEFETFSSKGSNLKIMNK